MPSPQPRFRRLRCMFRISTTGKSFASIPTSRGRRWAKSRGSACIVICWESEPQWSYFKRIKLIQKQPSGIQTLLPHFVNQCLSLVFQLVNQIPEITQLFLLLCIGGGGLPGKGGGGGGAFPLQAPRSGSGRP